jgi:hypothetical protein
MKTGLRFALVGRTHTNPSPRCPRFGGSGFLSVLRRIVTSTPGLLDRIIEANRILIELDAMEGKYDLLGVSSALGDAALVYRELLALQKTTRLSQIEAVKLQIALSRLRARLRFYGNRV